ncbi:hypothetical protein GBA52_002482 [Prunus armeniaca]|nr:hypothetical protein GBA52_002482 [Prunus armeniaca]
MHVMVIRAHQPGQDNSLISFTKTFYFWSPPPPPLEKQGISRETESKQNNTDTKFLSFLVKGNYKVSGTDIYYFDSLLFLPSAKQVEVNRKQSRVTVTGYVEPNKVLKKVKSTGKKAELWPYVPYNLVAYPYATGAYDKKAPSGYVRNVAQALPSPGAPDDKYTTMFSDENPNACSIM